MRSLLRVILIIVTVFAVAIICRVVVPRSYAAAKGILISPVTVKHPIRVAYSMGGMKGVRALCAHTIEGLGSYYSCSVIHEQSDGLERCIAFVSLYADRADADTMEELRNYEREHFPIGANYSAHQAFYLYDKIYQSRLANLATPIDYFEIVLEERRT
jgi:hypothetical protein